jgi:hypothetical protein
VEVEEMGTTAAVMREGAEEVMQGAKGEIVMMRR